MTEATPQQESCGNCRFMRVKQRQVGGVQITRYECHRTPPNTMGWGQTRPGEWCGEHRYAED